MKLLLQAQIMETIIVHYMQDEKLQRWEAEQELEWLIMHAYTDFNNHSHLNGLYDKDPNVHDELCMWCNFHASIYDACVNGNYVCMDPRIIGKDIYCSDCLKNTTWYRRIL